MSEPDVQGATSTRWPVGFKAMQATGLGAVFAFPMRRGTPDIGVVDLYTMEVAANFFIRSAS